MPPVVLNPDTATTPATTPPPVPPSAPPASPAGADPAWYDVPGQIATAITNWFRDLLHDALGPVIDLMARTALVTPDLTAEPRLIQIWSITQGIANSAYVLLVVAGGVVVMSHETLQTRHAFKQVAPRIVLGFVALNVSLSVVGEAVRVTNATAAALLGTEGRPEAVAERLKAQLLGGLDQAGIFMMLLALVIVALAVVLLIVFVMRVALTVLLVAVAPLALACHALPATDGAARLWWRGLLGVLGIQLAQALTLIVALQVFFAPTGLGGFGGGGVLMDLVVTLVMVWVLVRIPAWISRWMFGSRPSTLSSLVKYAVLSRALGRVGLGRSGGRRAVAGRAAAGRSGFTNNGRTMRGWSGRVASVEFGDRPAAGAGSGGSTARRATAGPRPTRRHAGRGANSPAGVAVEYPAGAGNRAAQPARWWGTPTFRAAGSRPPVGAPRFQPPRPSTPTPAAPRPATARPATARPATARPAPFMPTFSAAASTPTASPPRPARVSVIPTFSDSARPASRSAAAGASPVVTFQAPGGASSLGPGSRRRGSGRAWIPPAATHPQPRNVNPDDVNPDNQE